MAVKDWGDIKKAKVLVIGHDPRLQKSDTIAEYCFFANYFSKGIPSGGKELSKYNLAKNTFEQIIHLTNGRYCADEIYLTNLCNEELPHAPKGKTVLIPAEKAAKGVGHILNILENSKIEYIFSASLQVNYWLQKLNFYISNEEFLKYSEPKQKGLDSSPPYYEPKKLNTFKLICGNIYKSQNGTYKIIPILHPKIYPLKGNFTCYQAFYDNIEYYFINSR